MKKENKGFSLVEIIIVVAIIAVLVGLLSPMYLRHVEKSKQVADVSNMNKSFEMAQIQYAEGQFQAGDVAFVDQNGKLTTEKPAKGLGKGKASKTAVEYSVGCCEQGVYDDTESHENDYLVVLFPTEDDEQIHVHWLHETEAGILASGGREELAQTIFAKKMVQPKYNADGSVSLARAILSGYSTSQNAYKVNPKDSSISFNELYGIDNYIHNQQVNAGTALKTWMQGQTLEMDASKCSVKIISSFDTTESTLELNKVYTVTQYLYYGADVGSNEEIYQYGERVVYAKRRDKNTQACFFYADEACTQKIDLQNNTAWEKN